MKKILFLFLLFSFTGFKFADKVTIYLIGDSTCATKNDYDFPETGWGQVINTNFNDGVVFSNQAINGRSTKSFRNEGHWKRIFNKLKPGDYVFIQFGHNDAKISDTTKYAAAQTDYRQNLLRYIEETRQKGAIPLLLTPIMRRNFDENGTFVDTHADYPIVMREVALQTSTELIDMHSLSKSLIEAHGVAGSKKIFLHYAENVFPKFQKGVEDNTHFSPYGAKLMANLVANELIKLQNPLKSFLKKTDFDNKFESNLPVVSSPFFKKDTFNIVKYGAKSDGYSLNTNQINQAISMCSQAGGGTVLIPKGIWLSGPITIKSNVNLHLVKGALLQFSKNYDDFPIVLTTWEGQEAYRCQALISGNNLENIAITGAGIMDGAGEVWDMLKKEKMTSAVWETLLKTGALNAEKDIWYPTESSLIGSKTPNAGRIINGRHPSAEELKTYKNFLRPNMLSLQSCNNILIEGITFQNSPAWTIHPLLCDHITIKNVTVKNNWYAPNSDAIDLESCRNGIVEGCSFDTGDDGITIKSGRDEQGRLRGMPTENFIIKNNIVYHAHGGFVVGSEMSGGVRNLYISDCTFMGSDVGLRFKTARGRGGIVENIYVNNINMTNIAGEAILFDMYYAAKDPVPLKASDNILPNIMKEPVTAGTPQFQEFYLKNIICKGAKTGILIRGLPEMNVKNISIENAYIESQIGIKCIEAQHVILKNINIKNTNTTLATLQNSSDILFDNLTFDPNISILLDIQGNRSEKILVINTKINKEKNKIVFEEILKKNILTIK